MPDSPHVSIIVPTCARRARVLRLLDALQRQTAAPSSFEVVVRIDGSNDGTYEAVAALDRPNVRVLASSTRRGRAAALNAGIAAAAGALLVFLDDDMEPAPQFVAAHLQAHHEQRAGGGGDAGVQRGGPAPSR